VFLCSSSAVLGFVVSITSVSAPPGGVRFSRQDFFSPVLLVEDEFFSRRCSVEFPFDSSLPPVLHSISCFDFSFPSSARLRLCSSVLRPVNSRLNLWSLLAGHAGWEHCPSIFYLAGGAVRRQRIPLPVRLFFVFLCVHTKCSTKCLSCVVVSDCEKSVAG
jgi:hypothetical protein